MSSQLYTTQYLDDTITLLEDQAHDLSKWSVYNDDEFNEEIGEIQEKIEALKLAKHNKIESQAAMTGENK